MNLNPSQAIRGAVGVAALGFVAAQTIKERRRTKVFGMNLDLQKFAKQVGNAADRLERTSEDVRMISVQAKKLSNKLA
ncbi:MAG TPA: hypothetical protein VF032_03945 [Thermoleophilaceae bacterium]